MGDTKEFTFEITELAPDVLLIESGVVKALGSRTRSEEGQGGQAGEETRKEKHT